MDKLTFESFCLKKELTKDELYEIFSGRDVVYNFLYMAFINPPDLNIIKMTSELIDGLISVAEPFDDEAHKKSAETLRDMLKARKKLKGDELKEYDTETLRQYTQIFCLTNSVRACESHYRSIDKLSRSEYQDDCLKRYAAFKLPKDKRYFEDEDFIANEFHYMSFLAGKCASSIEKSAFKDFDYYLKEQHAFMTEHILGWAHDFAKEVYAYPAAERFYKPLCLFMEGFINYDTEFLNFQTE